MEPADEGHCRKFGLSSDLHSAALRECFEETGLYFSGEALVESERLARLGRIRLEYIADEFSLSSQAKPRAFEKLSELLPPAKALVPFLRLITIPEIKQRYDTTFFAHAIEDYRFANFLKFAEHERHLHSLEQVVHCQRESASSRWMTPAQVLGAHFGRTALLHPPQFIMLNIMLRHRKRQHFLEYLRSFPTGQPARRNLNLAPNIVSLVRSSHPDFPYAATLVGDADFPFARIIGSEQTAELQEEMREWQEWQSRHLPASRNRFLFKEGKNFFQQPYGVQASAPDSAVGQVSEWAEAVREVELEAALVTAVD